MYINRYQIKTNFTINPSLYIIQCGYEDCAPNHSYGPRVRDHNLIHFILSGSGTLEILEQKYHLSAGDGFLIPTGVPAKYTADSDNPWTYCWFGFEGAASNSIMSCRNLSALNNIFKFKDYKSVRDCILSMVAAYERDGNDFTTIAKMFEAFSYINPDYHIVTPQTNVMHAIFEYIENHFAEDISIDELAKQFNLSRTQLFRYFKGSVNMPPQQYIKRYRINHAANLLRSTKMKVDDIKKASGFKDLCNFSRQFSAIYKRSPSAFRKYANENIDLFQDPELSSTNFPKN